MVTHVGNDILTDVSYKVEGEDYQGVPARPCCSLFGRKAGPSRASCIEEMRARTFNLIMLDYIYKNVMPPTTGTRNVSAISELQNMFVAADTDRSGLDKLRLVLHLSQYKIISTSTGGTREARQGPYPPS